MTIPTDTTLLDLCEAGLKGLDYASFDAYVEKVIIPNFPALMDAIADGEPDLDSITEHIKTLFSEYPGTMGTLVSIAMLVGRGMKANEHPVCRQS